jgi:molybdopterin-synthase adenylyltransferase
MPILGQMRPLLPSHYYILYEPPDDRGDEALQFVSQRRRIKVKGTMLREFRNEVLPLLDGRHTLDEIRIAVAETLPAQSVDAALGLLESQNVVIASVPHAAAIVPDRVRPQLNFFHEAGLASHEVQRRLADAKVVLLGLGGVGSLVAAGLASAGVGQLGLIDDGPVRETDRFSSPIYTPDDVGRGRALAVQRALDGRFERSSIAALGARMDAEGEIAAALGGADFVVCCVDPAQSAYRYKLNRACHAAQIPWIACSAEGFEGIVGPTIRPGKTPCYLCYTMRSVATAGDPEADFAFHQFLDNRRIDDSDRRESLGFSAGLIANLAGLEILKSLAGLSPGQTDGAILVLDILHASVRRHVVLRNPRCPVCFPPAHQERRSD